MTTLDDPNQYCFLGWTAHQRSDLCCGDLSTAVMVHKWWQGESSLSWLYTQSGTWFFPSIGSMNRKYLPRPMTWNCDLVIHGAYGTGMPDIEKRHKKHVFLWFVACSHSCTVQNQNLSCNQEWQCPVRGSILICILFLRYWYWLGVVPSKSSGFLDLSKFQLEIQEKERHDQGQNHIFFELFALRPGWPCQLRRFRCHWVRHSTARDTLAGHDAAIQDYRACMYFEHHPTYTILYNLHPGVNQHRSGKLIVPSGK